MVNRKTSNEEKYQSNDNSNESFDDLLQEKHEADQLPFVEPVFS